MVSVDKLKSIMNAAECFDTNVDILPCLSSSLIHYNKSDLNKSLFLVGSKRKNETKSLKSGIAYKSTRYDVACGVQEEEVLCTTRTDSTKYCSTEHKIFCTNDNYQENNHSCVELNRTQTVPAETIAGTYSMNMPQLELTDNKQHQVDLVPDGLDPGATCTEKSETLSSNFKPSELNSFGVDDASVGLNRYGEATSSEGSESSYFDLVPSGLDLSCVLVASVGLNKPVNGGTYLDNPLALRGLQPYVVDDVLRMVNVLFPNEHVSEREVRDVVTCAYIAADDDYGELEAVHWGGNFVFPEGVGDRDAVRLNELGGDLSALTRERHLLMASIGRLSVHSIHATIRPSDPDFDLLLSLVEGIPIVTAAAFVPNSKPPPLRAKYLRVASAVNKMMFELYLKGLIFIIPTVTALTINGIHFSSTHWAKKKGKAQGRPIGDASSDAHGSALNSSEVKQKVDEMWGSIKHPTIDTLVRMIYRVAKRVGWSKVVMWKIDLKGAFSLMFIKPEDVQLLAFELTDGLSMIYHTGMFGHSEMPCGFDIITRVLRRSIGEAIHPDSECDAYVDDIMGASSIDTVLSDMTVATGRCNKLLGPNAVESTKSSWGRRVDIIGWSICLDTRTVSIARHNFYKALYGFFSIDENKTVPVRVLQKLASWGSRYAAVCRHMRPFSHMLYTAVGNVTNRNATRHLNDETRVCIRLWRCCLCLMEMRSKRQYSRRMSTYIIRAPRYLIEFDGSLSGVGIKFFKFAGGVETLWKVARFVFPFDLGGDSSYQNTCEFIALVLAMGCLISLNVRENISLAARGDSTTALTWSITERFRSGPSRNATMCYMVLGVEHDIHFERTEHIRGVDNIICDKLSRHHTPEQLGFGAGEIINTNGALTRLLNACNPLLLQSELGSNSFEAAWAEAYAISTELQQK